MTIADFNQFQIASVYSELEATGQFDRMTVSVDEDEHSLEMHLPYIARVMDRYVRTTPVLVWPLILEIQCPEP